ncbi:hypothetical protein BD311DRAFT_651288 [Dichomitus squalens]|uniref:Uncharacterized protein n=1 Tax=Dichomitus squalens TaxID=114155 RepID=A0A4Q9N4P0_9APHY|nr:hypothetical protein BD311DRAFT_651288 [Dichomitus squalens]
MSSSGSSTHTFAKRDVGLTPPLIAGIVVVVVGLNLIIAISWCILKDRKKLKKAKLHKRRISGPVDVEMYENSAAFAISTGANPVAVALKTKGGARGVPSEGVSYYELIRSVQQPAHQSQTSLAPSSKRSSNRSSPDSAKLKQFILRPQDMKHLGGVPYYPKTKQGHGTRPSVTLGVPTPGGLTRANSLSADTASIYSSASAPLEQHERFIRSQPFALQLETIPASAPAWMTEMPKPPAPAIVTDTTPVKLEISIPSPTASTSGSSESTTFMRHEGSSSRTSSALPSPISMPNSSMPSLIRARTNSNPSAPPQIRWLTKNATQDAARDTAPSPAPSRRPNSISSLSTIFSLREIQRFPTAPMFAVAPLNVRRQSNSSRWGSVDMTRGGAPTSQTAQPSVAPAVPKRSPFRPTPSASAEHLPR